MNLCESPLSSFRLLLFSFLACVVGTLAAQGQQPSASLPEFENEFFNDFSGSVSNSQKIEISRNLRLASETSQIHAMIVVIKKVADYPGLPQDVHAMALQLARERKVGSQKTRQGLLALFALEDHKFTVAHSTNLSPKLAESIRDTFNGRVRAKLRDGQTGQALVFASEDFASLLPKAGAAPKAEAGTKPGASIARAPAGPAPRPALAASADPAKPEPQKEAGFGWGMWLALIVGGYVLISLLGRLFSGGGGGGLGGGGSPGWGGLLGGLLGGGLLGYWLGNSSSNASEPHHDGGGTGSAGGQAGGSAPDGGTDSSEAGGFDSFGGGDFGGDSSGGGGSDGDW